MRRRSINEKQGRVETERENWVSKSRTQYRVSMPVNAKGFISCYANQLLALRASKTRTLMLPMRSLKMPISLLLAQGFKKWSSGKRQRWLALDHGKVDEPPSRIHGCGVSVGHVAVQALPERAVRTNEGPLQRASRSFCPRHLVSRPRLTTSRGRSEEEA